MNCQAMSLRSQSHLSRDILLLHGAQLGAQHGRRRRRCPWAAAARARVVQRGAARCLETIRVQGKTHAPSGTGTIGSGTHHTDRRRSQTERRRAQAASRGAWRGCCTLASASSLWALLFISLAPATRVSKRPHCGWWAHHSSLLGSRVVWCALLSAYLRSHAADGGPITRRAEDCQATGKARRCLWQEAGAVPELARRSARPRAASTPLPATSPVSPAARRTSACVDIAQQTIQTIFLCHKCLRNRAFYNKVRSKTQFRVCKFCQAHCGKVLLSRPLRSTPTRLRQQAWCGRVLLSRAHFNPARRSRVYCSQMRPSRAHSTWGLAGLRLGTCHLRGAQTVNSSSVPPNCGPNPQAIKFVAISFLYSPNNLTISDRYDSVM